jgi:WD40 repeat protein
VRLWSLPGGKPVGELRGHDVGRTAVAFSPDGTRIASVGHEGSLRIWRLLSGAEERAVTVQEMDPISISNTTLLQVAFSPDGNLIAVAGTEGISLWRSADLTLIERKVQGAVAATFAPDGALLTSGGDGQLLTVDSPGATPTPVQDSTFIDFAPLPGGGVATLSTASLTIWRGPLNALQHYADATATSFSSIAAGPQIIALGSRLGAVQVWAVR